MSEIKSHFVFGTTAAYSHVPPIIELSISLLKTTPDLVISVLLHINNHETSLNLIDNENLSEDVKSRIKLWPVGEKRNINDMHNLFFDMIYKSGEVYAGILLGSAPWPNPTVFIYDAASFFYVMIKSKVEEKFPHIKPTRTIAYNPVPVGEVLFLAGSEENGSIRWLDRLLDETDPDARVKPEQNLLSGANNNSAVDPLVQAAWMEKFAKAYKACLFESDRTIKIPGYKPFHAFERWGTEVDYGSLQEIGWFQYLSGYQQTLPVPEQWITCYPSSVIEPETLEALKKDEYLTSSGKKPFIELGWYERKPKQNWGEGVKSFLDKYDAKSVVYISFGTVVNAGPTLPALFEYLEETKTPYIYAYGNQKSTLPENMRTILEESEKQGLCLAPDWVDQVGVLSHKSVKCFISHCGANSTIEGIEAGVPIIAMGRKGDQVLLSSRIHDLDLGIELLQHRTGYSIGKELTHRKGILVKGTKEALKEELVEAFNRINGPEGDEMRLKSRKLSQEIEEKRQGEWKENIQKFGLYGRE